MRALKWILGIAGVGGAAAAVVAVVSGDDKAGKLPDDEPPVEEPPAEDDEPFAHPIPQPTLEPEGGAVPSNVLVLDSPADFVELGLDTIFDGKGGAPRASMVVLGMAPEWPAVESTFDRVVELGREHPGVTFVVFDFQWSRETFGEPSDPIAFVVTAVGPGGDLAEPVVGQSMASKLSSSRLEGMADFALEGPPQTKMAPGAVKPEPELLFELGQGGELFEVVRPGLGMHSAAVRAVKNQLPDRVEWLWQWLVWPIGTEGLTVANAVATGQASSKPKAKLAAIAYVQGYGVMHADAG